MAAAAASERPSPGYSLPHSRLSNWHTPQQECGRLLMLQASPTGAWQCPQDSCLLGSASLLRLTRKGSSVAGGRSSTSPAAGEGGGGGPTKLILGRLLIGGKHGYLMAEKGLPWQQCAPQALHWVLAGRPTLRRHGASRDGGGEDAPGPLLPRLRIVHNLCLCPEVRREGPGALPVLRPQPAGLAADRWRRHEAQRQQRKERYKGRRGICGDFGPLFWWMRALRSLHHNVARGPDRCFSTARSRCRSGRVIETSRKYRKTGATESNDAAKTRSPAEPRQAGKPRR